MERKEIKQWLTILKEKNPLGMHVSLFDQLVEPDKSKFNAELQIAKLIHRLLPDSYEEALKIYVDVLNQENIERALRENKDEELEEIIEEIICGYINAAHIFQDKKVDLQNAFKYIDEGKAFMNRYAINMTYISRGEVYYIRWRILEQLGKVEVVLEEINALLK